MSIFGADCLERLQLFFFFTAICYYAKRLVWHYWRKSHSLGHWDTNVYGAVQSMHRSLSSSQCDDFFLFKEHSNKIHFECHCCFTSLQYILSFHWYGHRISKFADDYQSFIDLGIPNPIIFWKNWVSVPCIGVPCHE